MAEHPAVNRRVVGSSPTRAVMNIAAIPVKNKIEWTAPLVEHLLLHDELERVWVYDNGSTDDTIVWIKNRQRIDPRLSLIEVPGLRLYDIWNRAIKDANTFCFKNEKCNLAILNNDIRLPPYAIRDMTALAREGNFQIAAVDPTRTGLYTFSIGWWDLSRALPPPIEPYCEKMHLGDRIGWAFVVATEFWKDEEYAIHPDFVHYFGDDDLYRRAMERGGNACVVRGIGCDHAESVTGGVNVEVWNKDEETFRRIWGGTSTTV